MKHPHYEVMMEWAADTSKVVQVLTSKSGWQPADMPPKWNSTDKYRIKPEKKPDVVRSAMVWAGDDELSYSACRSCTPNVKYTFDGETGKLIKAEVI